ncbi:MAG: NUDIX hydrolase [Balneolales bacterium]
MNTKETDQSLLERKISSDNVYSGTLLHVFKDRVTLPNGNESVREWIDHPGASAVLPVFKNGDIQLVKQHRYPLHQNFLEVPAGKIDPGEDPLDTAKRELEEECGIRGMQWISLGLFHPSIGYTNEVIYLYLTWNLEVKDNRVDDDEFVKPVRMPFQKAVNDAFRGEISDGKTITNILRAAHWWNDNGPFRLDIKF